MKKIQLLNYVVYHYQKILDFEKERNEKITWFKCENGYIAGKIKEKQLYIHQVITGYYR